MNKVLHFLSCSYISTKQYKAGAWGLLEVLSGQVDYVEEDSGRRTTLSTGDRHIIEPELLHHVEPEGPLTMQVHFFKERPLI